MIKAWIVVNEFLNTNKFTELNMWLVEAAKKKEIQLTIKTNAEIIITLGGEGNTFCDKEEWPRFVLFWDKDIRLAKYMESKGILLFNCAKAIEICDDKALTHIALQGAGIRMPKTMIAPMTYSGVGYTNFEFLKQVESKLGFPLIVKECFGSFGQQVYMVHNKRELLNMIVQIGVKPILFQEYISTSAGRDIRINVVGNKVVASMYRYSEDGDFRANISNGGKMKQFNPSQNQMNIAIECCKIIGLDFAGVDLLFGENEEIIVCEVNSNAHFKNIFECTGVDIADYIIDHIVERLFEELSS